MKRISATTISTLKKVRILIAEDDFIVANDLAEFFDLAGATVIGPFPTLLKAMAVEFHSELSRFFHREVSHL